MTRLELASAVKVNASTVRRWELDLRDPHLADLFALASAFSLSPEDLVSILKQPYSSYSLIDKEKDDAKEREDNAD